MNRITRLLLLLTLSIFLITCKKNNDSTGSTSTPIVDETITASVQGRIIDELGSPVSNASVSIGNATLISDINGSFLFSNVQLQKYFGKVKITKQGYFSVTKTIVTSTTGISYVSVELLTRRVKGSFSSATAAAVSIENGSSVSFPANSIVTASNGSAYSGTVTVYAAWLNPTDPDLDSRMPGDLRGIDSLGKSVALRTFGMVVAELEGSSGEKLQMANGMVATINLPIPTSLQSSAPATIPLWYFNDSTGQWAQQGSATSNGNQYTGTVSHFSYWNCDVSGPIVYINGLIKDQSGNPVANTKVAITDPATGETRSAYSGSDGSVGGGLIANTPYTLQVLNKCGDVLATKDIGPFSGATAGLGTITVTLTAANSLTITGTAVDCSSNPVANGYAEITLEGFKYDAPIINGTFSVVIDRCNSAPGSAFLVAGDYGNLALSTVQTFNVTTGNFNAGQVVVCGTEFSQFISFTVGGSSYAITVPPDSITFYNQYFFEGTGGNYNTPSFREFSINPFNVTSTGIFNVNMEITVGTTNYFVRSADPAQLTITQYPSAIGQDFLGTFSANMYTDTLNPATLFPVSGTLKARRNY